MAHFLTLKKLNLNRDSLFNFLLPLLIFISILNALESSNANNHDKKIKTKTYSSSVFYVNKKILDKTIDKKEIILSLSFVFISGLFLAYYAYLFLFKKITKIKIKDSLSPGFLRDIFSIYLLSTIIFNSLFKTFLKNPSIETIIKINSITTASLFLIVLFPIFYKIKPKKIFKSIGLYVDKKTSIIKEISIGISVFFALIIPFFFIMTIYAQILKYFKIDFSKATHPIIDLIKENSLTLNSSIWIFILGVVISPIIEEIMFRGAFYYFLKNKINTTFAILISSLVFASIHPQGLIGIFPLTIIGGILAFLREYRSSLISSISAHAILNFSILSLYFFKYKFYS